MPQPPVEIKEVFQMTVREFALAACDPKKLEICLGGASYSLLNSYNGKVDAILLSVFGDYVVDSIICNEAFKYVGWVKEVPVKEERP